mmetsp:Transcript_42995/g.77734  ORF Transcript_42995/g.77734 Transcript_42995/m.77734 type:complete len:132 (+) Transcript_42995:637-1032(+)
MASLSRSLSMRQPLVARCMRLRLRRKGGLRAVVEAVVKIEAQTKPAVDATTGVVTTVAAAVTTEEEEEEDQEAETATATARGVQSAAVAVAVAVTVTGIVDDAHGSSLVSPTKDSDDTRTGFSILTVLITA